MLARERSFFLSYIEIKIIFFLFLGSQKRGAFALSGDLGQLF